MKDVFINKNRIILFGICLFVIGIMGISAPAMATLPSWIGTNSCGVSITAVQGTAPVIDGAISQAEWGDAQGCNINFLRDSDTSLVPGHLRFKHDGTNLYILILIDTVLTGQNTAGILFDTDNSNNYSIGDDGLVWDEDYPPGVFDDIFYASGEDGWESDTWASGSIDGEAAKVVYTDTGEYYTALEFRHPLNSGDGLDFALNVGDVIPFNMGFSVISPDSDWVSYIYPSTYLSWQQLQIGTPTDPCAGLGGDIDGDAICDDGDGSGTPGDNPCVAGNTIGCDDNCVTDPNSGQEDEDTDGIGNVCDEDLDNDGILNSADSCFNTFDSGVDSDDDGKGDVCDNCRYVPNSDQADGDGDLLGDVCDTDVGNGIDNVLTAPTTTFNPGQPFWVTADIQNKTGQPIQTLRPDCYNTHWSIPGATPLARIGPAYGIPTDIVTIPAGGSYPVTCDINTMFKSIPGGSTTFQAIYENSIQDPAFDPLNPTACTETANPECYPLWIGAVASQPIPITVSTTISEMTDADVSFNPDHWDEAWATGNSPPISAKISNNADGTISVNDIDVTTILLNGSEPIIAGSKKIVGDALYVQFDRAGAVQSLGGITPGIPASATVQGEVGDKFFSGTRNVMIVADSGELIVKADLHTVGAGSHPGSTKTPIVGMETRVFDKSSGSCAAGYGISWQHYSEIWEGCDQVAGIETNDEGKAMFALAPGDYLVIGHYYKTATDDIYIGRSVGGIDTGDEVYKYLQVIKKANGKKCPAKYRKFTGSDLLVIEPEYVEWSSDTELYPFVFDSVGDWTVTTAVTPPEGFVADNDALSAEVNNEVDAIQFTITDVGSRWIPTKVTHKIKHKTNHKKYKEITVEDDIDIKLTPELAQQKGTSIYGDDQGEDQNDDQHDNQDETPNPGKGKGKNK